MNYKECGCTFAIDIDEKVTFEEIQHNEHKEITGDNTIITFRAVEDKFCTEYHFCRIEGLKSAFLTQSYNIFR